MAVPSLAEPDPALMRVVRILAERGETVAVVESLTGGLLAAEFVAIPGVSAVFRGGLVVYATDLKASLAGVPADLLADRGPVDGAVAVEMAEGGRARCRADWGISTTGVAGPDPQDGHPAGTVFVAVAGPQGHHSRRLTLAGDRTTIRAQTTRAALALFAEIALRPETPGADLGQKHVL